jgi:hypothetical protein
MQKAKKPRINAAIFGDAVQDTHRPAHRAPKRSGTVASPARLPDSGTPESLLMLDIIIAGNPLKINQFEVNRETKMIGICRAKRRRITAPHSFSSAHQIQETWSSGSFAESRCTGVESAHLSDNAAIRPGNYADRSNRLHSSVIPRPHPSDKKHFVTNKLAPRKIKHMRRRK